MSINRYPGAQPFRDSEFSQRTFFGREPASRALTDQILANRLVVVYAKSGLGKTSLLNAGVAPRLREASSLPLFVRVNDIQRGPLTSVFEGIRAEAERQKVEYVPGDTSSLWSFFKSVEFWRGDLLLSPVLILDQFEELFTLQSDAAREAFLSELGYLIRGVPPPSQPPGDSGASPAPPSVRVVLSLREDFLGLLEDAADRIPQIMDHRFRLTPLNCETAAEAITGPAAIHDPSVPTKPFRLDPAFVTTILNYLTTSTSQTRTPGNRYIEPFHLQLICQRIETLVALKQQTSSAEIVFTLQDLGGETALAQTLTGFYTDAIQSVPDRQLRGAVRRLCEEYLISPEGRRLSIEERELQRQLKLRPQTLSQLVDCRLLRTDRRSDSTYYELSHDALVQPVLASRRTQALVAGWAAVVAGSVVSFAAVGAIVLFIFVLIFDKSLRSNPYDILGVFICEVASVGIGSLGASWLRSGLRKRRRYRRHTADEFVEPLPALHPFKDRLRGWALLAVGAAILAPWGLLTLVVLLLIVTMAVKHGQMPHWIASSADSGLRDPWQKIHDRPFVEITWISVELSTIIAFGTLLFRKGVRVLWPNKLPDRATSASGERTSWLTASLKLFSATAAFTVTAAGVLALRQCAFVTHGNLPNWLSRAITSSALLGSCVTLSKRGWEFDETSLSVFFLSATVFAIMLVRSGIRDARSALILRRLARNHAPEQPSPLAPKDVAPM